MDIGNVEIRTANRDDINSLCAFEVEARATEPTIWVAEFDKDEYAKKLSSFALDNSTSNKIVLAALDGRVVGRCDLVIIQSLFDFTKTGYIDWIYTLSSHRGHGIGKKMLLGAEEYLRLQGVTSYYLFTAANEQATEFYHRQSSLKFSQREVAERDLGDG